jgi:O-antigen ligase
MTLGAGATVLALARMPRRGVALVLASALALGAIGVAAVPPLRERAAEVRGLVAAGRVDALTSYRLGAWAAALEMVAARPVTGHGPGTFGPEFVEHRLAAESRWGRRLANPYLLGGSYEEAHCDYLQLASESGLAVTLLLAVAAGLAGMALRGGLRDGGVSRSGELRTMVATVAALAVAALTWFPMQRPATALLACCLLGRIWSMATDAGEESR